MLFDDDFIKKLPKTKQFENPWVVGICKMEHNKELRTLIEKWFQHIPEAQRPKLKTRLRSLKDDEFISAFYELAVHQFCIEEGWSVEYEPTLASGLTPDLVVTTDTGHKFILDATTVFDSGDLAKANTKKVELTHQISAIKTNKILNLHYLELPTATARPKVITKLVSQWLESLPSTVRRRKKVFNASGYNLEVEASSSGPKPKGGCIFSVMDPGMSVPDYSRRIKSVLDDKRRKYSSKNTGLPLVVMVGDAVGLVRTDEGAIDKTLFGQHQITFSLSGDDPPQMQRDRSGYFTPRNAPDGTWSGKNTGVSAVMYASLKEKGSFQMQVFHNPLPHLTLEEQTFQKMPQLLRFSTTPGITMRWTITNPEHLRVYFS